MSVENYVWFAGESVPWKLRRHFGQERENSSEVSSDEPSSEVGIMRSQREDLEIDCGVGSDLEPSESSLVFRDPSTKQTRTELGIFLEGFQ